MIQTSGQRWAMRPRGWNLFHATVFHTPLFAGHHFHFGWLDDSAQCLLLPRAHKRPACPTSTLPPFQCLIFLFNTSIPHIYVVTPLFLLIPWSWCLYRHWNVRILVHFSQPTEYKWFWCESVRKQYDYTEVKASNTSNNPISQLPTANTVPSKVHHGPGFFCHYFTMVMTPFLASITCHHWLLLQ